MFCCIVLKKCVHLLWCIILSSIYYYYYFLFQHVLKRIDLHQASKREQRAAYLEAKLLSTIKHPNIVTYLDSFHNSFGSLFIVMCYCECGDLYSFIRNQNGVYFEEKQIVHWFVQICLALKVKPFNFFYFNVGGCAYNNIIILGGRGSLSFDMNVIFDPIYIWNHTLHL